MHCKITSPNTKYIHGETTSNRTLTYNILMEVICIVFACERVWCVPCQHSLVEYSNILPSYLYIILVYNILLSNNQAFSSFSYWLASLPKGNIQTIVIVFVESTIYTPEHECVHLIVLIVHQFVIWTMCCANIYCDFLGYLHISNQFNPLIQY